jgi:hypothetical protein
MAREEPMLHVSVFEKLGELQTRLQFSHLNNDVGAQARTWLHSIDEAKEKTRHAELLAEIKRPHWSVTPSFYLLVVSVLLSTAALVVAFIGLPQSQQSAAATSPSVKTPPPVTGNLSNSSPVSPSSSPTQTGKHKR